MIRGITKQNMIGIDVPKRRWMRIPQREASTGSSEPMLPDWLPSASGL
ncbi:hypothetical protein PhaeoP88_04357 (plasmid) [Phaeobacter inhibens]|uniref:Uncharacterized protein n=1 Tax=Phaeobacter inhibens TaxID=221822 RepID=A0A2I7KGE7_9RHOB|nr:hypothetical protein PhaeoP88_04357 [Phaeobacter inhibens]